MKRFIRASQAVVLRRALFKVHLWIGVLAGVYVSVVCVTGAALVFRIDMQRALHPDLFTPSAGPPAAPARILDALQEAYPDDGLSFIDAPSTVRPVWLAYLIRGREFPAVLVDPVSARVLGEVPTHSLVRTLQELHFDLLAGRTGRIVNGIGAGLLLALCVTGIVIWWPGVGNWRRGLTVDVRRHWRRVIWDLHSAIGIWTVALIAMWAVTGVYFVFPSQFRAAVNRMSPLTVTTMPQRGDVPPGVHAVSWAELIDRARQHVPGQEVARVVLPSTDRAPFQVMFSRSIPLPPALPDLTTVYLDPFTGERMPAPPPPDPSLGDTVMMWVAPLHVGNFAGNGVRVAWLIIGLAPPLLFVTGFTMWWARIGRVSVVSSGGSAGSGGSGGPVPKT